MPTSFSLPPKKTFIDHTSVISADIASVHRLISDIDAWPSWVPGFISVKRFAKGPVEPGNLFIGKIEAPVVKSMTVPSFIYRNDLNMVEWGMGLLGSQMRHFMELKALDANTTQLRHVEFATGLMYLTALPAAKFAGEFDLRWSKAIERYFK